MMLYSEVYPFVPVDAAAKSALVKVCQSNPWLKRGGVDFEDDPYMERDYRYTFNAMDDMDQLKAFLSHGNWSIRQGVVFRGTLALINQVNGGDEWWTLRLFEGRWVPFESISFENAIECGRFYDGSTFEEFILRLLAADETACRSLKY